MAEALSWLFDDRAIVCTRYPSPHPQPLWPEESGAMARAASARIAEFAGGRACARQAMAALGVDPAPIPVAADRSPVWPAGLVGSISHCDSLYCAAVTRAGVVRAIGVDVEPVARLPVPLAMVCGPEERNAFACLPPLQGTDWGMAAFVAKEAYYKCQYRLTGRFLDFRDGIITFDGIRSQGDGGEFDIALRSAFMEGLTDVAFCGRWVMTQDHILAGATFYTT